jgi:hypothetical protein
VRSDPARHALTEQARGRPIGDVVDGLAEIGRFLVGLSAELGA